MYDKFLTFAGKLAASCLADRGWTAQPTDGHLDTLLRAMGISMSLSYNNGDADLLAEVRSRFDAYAADPSGPNGLAGDLIVPVFRYLLKNGECRPRSIDCVSCWSSKAPHFTFAGAAMQLLV